MICFKAFELFHKYHLIDGIWGEGEGEECLLYVDAYTELNVSAPLIKRLCGRALFPT